MVVFDIDDPERCCALSSLDRPAEKWGQGALESIFGADALQQYVQRAAAKEAPSIAHGVSRKGRVPRNASTVWEAFRSENKLIDAENAQLRAERSERIRQVKKELRSQQSAARKNLRNSENALRRTGTYAWPLALLLHIAIVFNERRRVERAVRRCDAAIAKAEKDYAEQRRPRFTWTAYKRSHEQPVENFARRKALNQAHLKDGERLLEASASTPRIGAGYERPLLPEGHAEEPTSTKTPALKIGSAGGEPDESIRPEEPTNIPARFPVAEYARLSNEKLERAQKEADKRAAAVRKAAEEDQERARLNEAIIQKDAEDEQKEADREVEARSVVEASRMRPAPIHVMYVPPSDVEAFETAAVRLGAFVSYNAEARTYEISEAVTSQTQVKDLVAHYKQGSRGHDRWKAAQQKQMRIDRRMVEAARTGKNLASDSEIRAASQAKLLPDNTPPKDRQSSDMRYVARARAAKDEGFQFVSAFIRRGFRLDPPGSTSHEHQMKLLNEAKLEELKEIAARTQMLWHAASQKGRQFFACLVLARGFEAIENRYREMTKQLLNGDSAPAPAPTKLASPSLNRTITPRSKRGPRHR